MNKPSFCINIPVVSIQAGKKFDGTRANTEDTLIEMARNINSVGCKNILFIYNNQYICYQDAVAKRALKSYNVEIKTVGEE